MFLSFTLAALLLGFIALLQSIRAEKKAHQNKLDGLRRKIEQKEKEKLMDKLNNSSKLKRTDNQ